MEQLHYQEDLQTGGHLMNANLQIVYLAAIIYVHCSILVFKILPIKYNHWRLKRYQNLQIEDL